MLPVPPSAFLDANVLFSRTLRDWICLIAIESAHTAYQLRWSEDVLAEWIYKVRKKWPDLSDQALAGQRRRLEESFEGAMVTGYDPERVPNTPDPHDRHVLAAAISASVDFLVTADKTGFPADSVRDAFEVVTPDQFLTHMAERHADVVLSVFDHQVRYWQSRADRTRDQAGILTALETAKVPTFAAYLRSELPGSGAPSEAEGSSDNAEVQTSPGSAELGRRCP